MKKPHIEFHNVSVTDIALYCATVTGELSWTPDITAYGYGFEIQDAIERAWKRWEMQIASDLEFPWSKHD